MSSGTRRAIASILVVEDDEAIAEALVDLLESEGYRAIVARDGTTALSMLREERVELMLLDLGLPDINGRELREKQVADEAIAGVPVIILTASAMILSVDNLPLIRKPFDCDYLMRVIRKELDLAEAARHRDLLETVSDVRRQMMKTVDELEVIRRAAGDGPPSSRRR
jgi:DNA-binding response OmpR family regulator